MPSKRILVLVGGALIAVFGLLATAVSAFAAATEKVLYSFCPAGNNCTDGDLPIAGLIFDAAGNLYGTTAEGGAYGYGTVFQLQPGAGGTWTENVLYSFCPGAWPCTDGAYPSDLGLAIDSSGNLYGTTTAGGGYQIDGCGGTNCGTVFELSPDGDRCLDSNCLA